MDTLHIFRIFQNGQVNICWSLVPVKDSAVCLLIHFSTLRQLNFLTITLLEPLAHSPSFLFLRPPLGNDALYIYQLFNFMKQFMDRC